MEDKLQKNLKRLINKLEGSPDGKQDPKRKILFFRKEENDFLDISQQLDKIDPDAKTLLLIHGTFSKTSGRVFDPATKEYVYKQLDTGSFSELLLVDEQSNRSFLQEWMTDSTYDQVIAYDHFTVIETITQNCVALMQMLQSADIQFSQDVDIITTSRGGLLGQFLAQHYGVNKANNRVPIGKAVLIASSSRGSALTDLDRLVPPRYKHKKKHIQYKKALKSIIDRFSIPRWPKMLLKLLVSVNGKMIVALLDQAGVKVQREGHEELTSIANGKPTPASEKGHGFKETSFLPIIGKYDGTPSDQEYMGEEIDHLINDLLLKYDEFSIFIFKLFRLKAKRILKKKTLEKSLRILLTKDVKPIIQDLIFKGKACDLVNGSESQYAVHPEHYAKGFEPKDASIHLSVAIHSYYFDEFFKPEGSPQRIKIKNIIRDWLEADEEQIDNLSKGLAGKGTGIPA